MAVVATALALALATASSAGPVVGEPAPPFTAVTLDGKDLSLDDLRGDVVIVNLWATWCAPCKIEMPLLEGYERLRAQYGLRVVAVAVDNNRIPRSEMEKLQAVLSLKLLSHFDGDYRPLQGAVPTNYVIDRAGVVRYAKNGAFDLDSLNAVLVPLLNEPLPAAPPPQSAAPSNPVPATPPPRSTAPSSPTPATPP
jgi:thiol-disulfide isomerase/thioredoxin